VDGLNLGDPGLRLIAEAVRSVGPADVVSICSGDIPGIDAGVRVILDERERTQTRYEVVEITDPRAAQGWPGATHAVVWPRAHLGKDFAQQMLARAGVMLSPGGVVLCSVRKQKGADSVSDFMAELFGNVRIAARDKGYRLLQSERGDGFDENRATELLGLRYRYADPLLGDLELATAPGVFSRKALDEGTRCLIDHAARLDLQPSKVLDLCAGVGPLACWALHQWPGARGLAVESNLIAAALAGENAASNGLDSRLVVVRRAGLPPIEPDHRAFGGQVDLALVNPPTHADAEALSELLSPLSRWMKPAAPALLVAARPEGVAKVLRDAGAEVRAHPYASYTILEAVWSAC
jgi:16S rRNA G1207 methylase RsmC